ncbi:hypothetical protein V2G26_011960 [Clonostachys chloroleuca]|uniref:Gfo/Idh/MocA-like oxidoreductase N-terminal domain-containing protein n=1 Tax=Clonostachys chloroleuca TaxID=1926264 RepID=A0AA35PZW1_9HYPO|nr:unnamed protein product [Clonostachys chloroleuca]
MTPLRIGLVGLGPVSTGPFNAGEWGIQHMNAIVKSPELELVAVCNSTEESALNSIASHGLPSTVKAYGSMEGIASDPNVDLVAVVVHLDKHYALAKTLLRYNKDLFIEYPATPSVAQTSELAELARSRGVRTIIGSQGRCDPAVAKLRGLIESRVIGDVVYSTFIGHTSLDASQGWPKAQSGALDLDSGISRLNIVFGHQIDAFISVLGTFSNIQSTFKTKEKTARLLDAKGNVVDLSYQITSPDIILVQGVLGGGAAASFQLRTNKCPADGVGSRWIISGTEGELVYTGDPGFFHMGVTGGKLTLKKWAAGAEEIDLQPEKGEYFGRIAAPVINILRLYEAFAQGKKNAYASIEDSLETQRLLDQVKQNAVWAP